MAEQCQSCIARVQNTLKTLLRALIVSENRCGMTLPELESDYRLVMGGTIPFAELGFERLEAFVESLSDTLAIQRNGDEVRVYAMQCAADSMPLTICQSVRKHQQRLCDHCAQCSPAERSPPTIAPLPASTVVAAVAVVAPEPPQPPTPLPAPPPPPAPLPADRALPDLADDDPLFMRHLPATVARFDAVVPPAQLPPGLHVNSVFLLNVAEVNSPTTFWFHVCTDDPPLARLMDQLSLFYDGHAPDNLPLEAFNAVPGLLCAARYNGCWHRARIVGCKHGCNTGNGTVKLHFFDYGTTVHNPVSDIRYLLLAFAELPVQAHRGCLDGVLPIDRRWCRDAFDAFYYFVANMTVYGRVVRVQPADAAVRMVLVNTVVNVADVILRDVLLQRNLAQPRWPNSVWPRFDMYPTFEMLETGMYPSFTEVDTARRNGFDYDEYLDSLIRPLDVISCCSAARRQRRYHPSNPFA